MKSPAQLRPVYLAGVAITKWGYFPDVECSDHGSKAIFDALDDAGLAWRDVQAVFSGSVYQGTASGHRTLKEVGMSGVPIVNVENACSSSASALRLAYLQVAAEIYDVVLVLGMEKNPKGPIPSNSFRSWELELGFNFHPANYAIETNKYMSDTGATAEDISLVTVKNRRNAALNPNARMQTPVTLQEVLASRPVAPPLQLLHCCPLADGAAAAVVCSEDRLRSRQRALRIAACTLTSAVYGEHYVPGGIVGSVKYPPATSLAELCAHQAYEISGYGPKDIDVVQAYDTVSASELWDVEELGFCGKGEAAGLLRDGVFDLGGRLPVNTDGGLMGRGHPMGATGLGQVVEIAAQLRGEAGPRQIAQARIGLAHTMGAGPNSSVTILTRWP